MRRLALESAVLSLLASMIVFPVACYGKPKAIRLPMLEVPDDLGVILKRPSLDNRAALLRSPVELSDANDRRVLARERRMWSRLNGSLCVGCGEAPALRKVSYVDPVAVLNAKSTVVAQPAVASRTAAPARAARVHLAHRHHHRSRLYAYYSRLRYAVLKWRRHHPRRRVRAVQHVPASPA
ncbi:hypothetical protein SAMN05216360_108159 [Methylobacterium phyllostachyos]|uniref:Uncharacterized protein n=1 Tax=Methylobacterium phyllostachyos TaxID=582672 RepID=A0A1H0BFQ5_9HYPH|nr:hypothetical protein [Methylobacterium phyllostachyos]SDN44478.1 hypothetical protein SAMN05216360_108159 [Methylobacterium phyllostachyos]